MGSPSSSRLNETYVFEKRWHYQECQVIYHQEDYQKIIV